MGNGGLYLRSQSGVEVEGGWGGYYLRSPAVPVGGSGRGLCSSLVSTFRFHGSVPELRCVPGLAVTSAVGGEGGRGGGGGDITYPGNMAAGSSLLAVESFESWRESRSRNETIRSASRPHPSPAPPPPPPLCLCLSLCLCLCLSLSLSLSSPPPPSLSASL